MTDTGRAFLEGQIGRAKEAYTDGLLVIEEAYKSMTYAKMDLETYEAALAAYTRDSPNPYKPEKLVEVLIQFRAPAAEPGGGQPTLYNVEFVPKVKPETGHKGKPWDFSWDTKAGVIRNMFKELGTATYDEVLEAVKDKNLSVAIDRGDLRRAVPKMVHRGEMRLLGKGRYEYLNVTDSR